MSRAGRPAATRLPVGSAPAFCHRRLEAQHGGHRRRGSVERPAETAEGDERGADRGLRKHDERADGDAAGSGVGGERPEHHDVRAEHDEQTPQHRLLAQARRLVLQRVQARPALDEAIDRPADEAEEAQLLGWRRIDGQPVGVLGVALSAADRRPYCGRTRPRFRAATSASRARRRRARAAPTTRTRTAPPPPRGRRSCRPCRRR